MIKIYINGKRVIDGLLCKNLFSRATGLMFRHNKGAVFILRKEQRVYLHNFFVFEELKAVLLDKNNKAVEIINMKPFKLYSSRKKAKILIELPKKINVKKGDIITWKRQ